MDTEATRPDELPSLSFSRMPFFQTRTSLLSELNVRNQGFVDGVTACVFAAELVVDIAQARGTSVHVDRSIACAKLRTISQ